MKIAIYGQSFDNIFNEPVSRLLNTLIKNGHEVIVFEELATFFRENIGFSTDIAFNTYDDLRGTDIVIGIGGDGTILNTLQYIRDSEIPVLGLNTGRLGFLSTVSTDEIDEVVSAIENREYKIEPRTVLQLKSKEGLFLPVNFALNEVAVHKNDISSMITINAFIDDVYINSYWADGLIVSTATGSTAYSMSCGGPIVMPGTETLIITPIAPHNLNIRPLVIPDSSRIRLVVEGREGSHLVSLDSRSQSLENTQTLEISKAPFRMNLVRVKDEHFIQTIRNKLMWGIDKRN